MPASDEHSDHVVLMPVHRVRLVRRQIDRAHRHPLVLEYFFQFCGLSCGLLGAAGRLRDADNVETADDAENANDPQAMEDNKCFPHGSDSTNIRVRARGYWLWTRTR